MRVRTPQPERSIAELHAIPCSINPWGEVGVLRLPRKQEASQLADVPDDAPPLKYRVRWAEEDAEREKERKRAYEAEIERRLRHRLEEHERRREQGNAENLASLFNRLGAKWGSIQEEKIETRRREIALAHFELQKHEKRRRNQAASKIQSWWRGIQDRWRFKARMRAHRKKLMQDRLHKYTAKRRRMGALHIQRVWRGWRQRLRYRELRAMVREDWLARRIRKQLQWLAMAASEKKDNRVKVAKSFRVLYGTRAAVRIQAWFRGWQARQRAKKARLLRMKMDAEGDIELERLHRIQREAVHTSSELTEHKDMTMIKRALKRRDIEDHERLTADLRKVREAARTVEADLQQESELDMASNVVTLKELTDFLEAKQLRMDRDKARQDADEALRRRALGANALHEAMDRERQLQESLDTKQAEMDLGRLRREAQRIYKDMAELTAGTSVFGRLQEMRRDLLDQDDKRDELLSW